MLWESVILAMALCVDSLVVSTTSSFKSNMSMQRGLLLAIIFGVFQGGLPLLGALIGAGFRQYVEAVDHWIAFGLLAAVGGRMIWEALRDTKRDDATDLSSIGMIIVMAVATSIDAFVVGVGFGLEKPMVEVMLNVVVIGVCTFVVSMIGVWLGRHNAAVPERTAGVVAGIVLIALGCKTLLEHLGIICW